MGIFSKNQLFTQPRSRLFTKKMAQLGEQLLTEYKIKSRIMLVTKISIRMVTVIFRPANKYNLHVPKPQCHDLSLMIVICKRDFLNSITYIISGSTQPL